MGREGGGGYLTVNSIKTSDSVRFTLRSAQEAHFQDNFKTRGASEHIFPNEQCYARAIKGQTCLTSCDSADNKSDISAKTNIEPKKRLNVKKRKSKIRRSGFYTEIFHCDSIFCGSILVIDFFDPSPHLLKTGDSGIELLS